MKWLGLSSTRESIDHNEKKGAEKEMRACVSNRLAYINCHDGNWIKVPELFAGTLHTYVFAAEHLAIVPRYNASLFGCNAQRKSFYLHRRKDRRIDGMSRIRRLKMLSDYSILCKRWASLLRESATEIVKRVVLREKRTRRSLLYTSVYNCISRVWGYTSFF